MKRQLLSYAIALLPLCIIAQNPGNGNGVQQTTIRCATHDKMTELRAKDPAAYDKNQVKQEQILQNWISKNYKSGQKVIYTIPVVVQIFGSTPNSQVTDNRVNEQIAVLNQDYRRLNTDTGQTPAAFKTFAADCEIEFCLATVDPQGNATSGIVRKTSSNSPTTSDLWNTSQYLNLLVYSISGGVLGYTYLPSQAPNNGVHIGYQYFGKTGASAPYNKGRTATHEVGHWLNLEHIWADESSCGADDGVSDTPQQKGENYGCPSYPQTTQSGGRCNTSDPSSMFMNYMDYSDDNCMNIFTAGQKARMVSAINQYRSGLLNNGKCGTSAPTDDAGIESITTPTGNICTTGFTPVVVLRNYGNQPLTSCTISYNIDSNSPGNYSWTGNLAAGSTANVTLSAMTASGGVHTFTAYTSNPNGNTDNNATNDQATGSFSISTIGQTLPFTEGFEGSTFIPAGWTLTNGDNAATWAKATVGYGGNASAFMDNYDYNASGQVDEMISPAVNLTTDSNPSLTFYVAYQLYTDPNAAQNWSDTLEVLISTDCGISYTSLYKKFSSVLTTVTPVFSTTEFVPSGQGDWRMETISLANYANSVNAIIKFRHATDYENNMYIDNINISGGAACALAATASSTSPVCGQNDGSIAVTVSGGTSPYSFLWNTGATTATVSGLAAGNYTVTITDAISCTATVVASVSNTNAPIVMAGGTDASAFGVCDGAASANATGGTSPYTYLWSNGAITSSTSGLCAGTYNITVTDAANCSGTSSVIVSQPSGISGMDKFFAVNIFPNPSDGNFIAQVNMAETNLLSISVYNIVGEKISELNRVNFSGGKIPLDLTNYSEGIYFVKLSTGNYSTLRKVTVVR